MDSIFVFQDCPLQALLFSCGFLPPSYDHSEQSCSLCGVIMLSTTIVISGFIFVGYLLSRLLKRNDVADGLWGLGFVGMAIAHLDKPFAALQLPSKLVVVFTFFWGFRLSVFLWHRLLGKTEDVRYNNWRKEWGETEPWRSFLQVFLLQGLIMGLISAPIIFMLSSVATDENLNPTSAWTVIGSCLFLIGFIIEAVADAELAAFKREAKASKSKLVFTSGLRAIVRHPSYLGEILVWWGIFLVTAGAAGGWQMIFSPLLLTFLLFKVSGVPMLNKVLEKRSPEFSEYVTTTPAIFPIRLKNIYVTGLTFLGILIALIAFDFVWLNLVMGSYYFSKLQALARIQNGTWDPILWAALGVYLFLASGIYLFVVRPSKTLTDSILKGAVLGLVMYGVYDLTNHSLVKDWSIEIAIVDMIWGFTLCSLTSAIGFLIYQRQSQRFESNK
jgi:steroid 5-alpha reductase family enzyme/uncharacterized membrane protein